MAGFLFNFNCIVDGHSGYIAILDCLYSLYKTLDTSSSCFLDDILYQLHLIIGTRICIPMEVTRLLPYRTYTYRW